MVEVVQLLRVIPVNALLAHGLDALDAKAGLRMHAVEEESIDIAFFDDFSAHSDGVVAIAGVVLFGGRSCCWLDESQDCRGASHSRFGGLPHG